MNEDSDTLPWPLVSVCATSIFSSGQTRAQDSTEDANTVCENADRLHELSLAYIDNL